jgi:hypothetical protein
MPKTQTTDRNFALELYTQDLAAINDGSNLIATTLAQDWTSFQEQSRLQVPRYLSGLDEEVNNHLERTVDVVGGFTNRFIKVFVPRASSHVQDIYSAKRLATAAKRFNETADKGPGGAAYIALYGRVFNELTPLSYRIGFLGTRAMIDELVPDEAVNTAFQTCLDYYLYRKARTNSTIPQALEYSRAASSDASSRMIRFALDNKVLRRALRQRGSGFSEAAQIVNEFASGPDAREKILGYLALRASDQTPRSQYKARYRPRLTEDAVRKERTTSRERIKQQEEAEFNRQQNDQAHSRSPQPNTPHQLERKLNRAIRKLPLANQKTLLTYERSELQRVIAEVNDMREADPDITARAIYLHFHARTQQPEPPDEALTTVKILGLFLNGDFSKTSRLPF